MEMCWLTTAKCNQHCNYCDRFRESGGLSTADCLMILDKLIDYRVKKLTFGGGESLMLECFDDIVKKGALNGIKFKLGTNGKLIPQKIDLLEYLDEITISIDSVDPEINAELGREADHYDNVCRALDAIQKRNPDFRININTVVTKINIDCVEDMTEFIEHWSIKQWRVFRFCPLRGTAVENRKLFEITSEQFGKVRDALKRLKLNCAVQFRDYVDMEKGYLLITPSGKLCVSRDLKDIVVGDMLRDDLRTHFA